MDDPGSSPARRSGGCQCGAVRFTVTGAAEDVSVCYCRMCQKASGGPFMSFARFPAGAVTWTRGQPSLFRSSSLAVRGFCPACGTPLTYQWREAALSLATGAFDDPASLPPLGRCGIEGRLDWTDRLAGLPGETAEGWLDARPGEAGRLVTYQHPDHDT